MCCAIGRRARTRGNKVRMPRSSRHASKPPSMRRRCCAPQKSAPRTRRMRAVVSAPAITSLWPFRYFVAECMTMSAPSASGRVSTGVAAVLSTASSAPAAMRDLGGGGDVGHLPQRIGRRLDPDELGPARFDRGRIASSEVASTKSVRRPSSRRIPQPIPQPQYITFGATTWDRRAAGLEHRGSRRHAGREQQGRGPAFERGQQRLRLVVGRIVGATIAAPAAVLVVGIALKGGREMNRQHNGPGRGIGPTERFCSDRGGSKGFAGHSSPRFLRRATPLPSRSDAVWRTSRTGRRLKIFTVRCWHGLCVTSHRTDRTL